MEIYELNVPPGKQWTNVSFSKASWQCSRLHAVIAISGFRQLIVNEYSRLHSRTDALFLQLLLLRRRSAEIKVSAAAAAYRRPSG